MVTNAYIIYTVETASTVSHFLYIVVHSCVAVQLTNTCNSQSLCNKTVTTRYHGLVTLHRVTLNRATVKLRQFTGR